jgi:exopolyphosphatase/guanosine-5'-triphosphate,3'-diphosphate pyrophosphatase
LGDDPPRAKQLLDMKEHIFDMQEGFGLDREIDMVICTGGSMNNVAYIKHYGNKEMRDSAVKYVERRFLKKLIFDMRGKSVKERVRSISGLEEKRGDIVLSAAMQTDMALQATATNGFYALSGGLRAGLTIDTINKKGIELPFQNNMENIRYSRLIEVGNKFDFDEETAVQVGKIAEKLFAGLEKELSLNTRDWYILEAASVLHDIGKHISYSKHHKHSYYLIRNSELVGYSFEEVEMIAQVARYHRKNPPKQSHEEYQALEEGMREKVDKLAGILRVAISLDRSHKGYINDLRVKIEDSQISIMPLTDDDISMERKDFERKKELLEKILGKPVKLV